MKAMMKTEFNFVHRNTTDWFNILVNCAWNYLHHTLSNSKVTNLRNSLFS